MSESTRSVPLRHRMFVRLLAATVLVGACTVAVTAWLAANSTSRAIRAEQGQTLAEDTTIYQSLLGYAATHPRWDEVGSLVTGLASGTGRRIALTTRDRTVIVDSAPGTPLPAKAASTVDPMELNPALTNEGALDGIDPRAVGPFRLSAAERERSANRAREVVDCLRRNGSRSTVEVLNNDRSVAENYYTDTENPCRAGELRVPSATEKAALAELSGRVESCLRERGALPVRLELGEEGEIVVPGDRDDEDELLTCLAESRRHQLVTFIAPSALLFVADPPGVAGLTAAGAWPLVLAGGLVLLVMVGVSAYLATRLLRPVHALAATAERMRDGDTSARVAVKDAGEIGRLSLVFNELSAHLEQAERQRRDMIGDISHELRSPLTTLRGWLEAAADGQRPMEPDLVNVLLTETLTLQQLIDDLQDLALAESGQLRLHPQRLPVAETLLSVAMANQAQAAELGLTVAVDAPENLVVQADPVRLRQAVANLVSNALRHTARGGQVTLSARADGPDVLITVADNGSGIDPEELPLVFDRFWRAEKSRSRRTGGSGLGLVIVRRLTEAQGGAVTATSTLGQGSAFTLRLPAAASGSGTSAVPPATP
ncbi:MULTISPECIES: ATP-binding protein [unclassified Crossiella]|uniref:ATP-binding protein n=1 Tax=unclassified Crossiella TaxID=2620835 RepID=UPI00200022DD|nr:MULTISPECIES: ATP-binding protein [unclassified Crossiella]MCK2241447.1 ATP-binding protein [Crossiella sp. S99.2]MCK2255681.1 ATP-binding protein [Crossiella sp. S99.1]